VLIQLFHAFLSRSFTKSLFVTGFLRNWWLLGAFFFSSGCLIAASYIPGLNTTLDMQPLTWWDWAKIGGGVLIHTVVVELIKVVLRAMDKRTKWKKDGKKESKSEHGKQYERIPEV